MATRLCRATCLRIPFKVPGLTGLCAGTIVVWPEGWSVRRCIWLPVWWTLRYPQLRTR